MWITYFQMLQLVGTPRDIIIEEFQWCQTIKRLLMKEITWLLLLQLTWFSLTSSKFTGASQCIFFATLSDRSDLLLLFLLLFFFFPSQSAVTRHTLYIEYWIREQRRYESISLSLFTLSFAHNLRWHYLSHSESQSLPFSLSI